MRKGSVIPLVLGMTSILAVLGFTLFWVSRQQLLSIHHYVSKEQGFYLARGGLEVAIGQMDQVIDFLNDSNPATFPKRDKAPEPLSRIVTAILDSQNHWVDEAKLRLESTLLSDLNLEVQVQLRRKQILQESMVSSVVPDSREVAYLLTLVAQAEVSGIKTKLTAFKEWRQVSILPPVLGKFTLFLLRPGGLELNAIPDAREAIETHHVPLILNSGARLPVDAHFSLSQTRDFLENQGWVYLGGSPWPITLSHGWGIAQSQDAYSDQVLEYYAVGTGVRSGKDQKLLELSLNPDVGDFEWWRRATGLYREFSEISEFEVLSLVGEDEVHQTSVLNLFGSREIPSPTIVIGDVVRKWALIQGLHNQTHGITACLPFLTPEVFALDVG
jgi:hypothetical protein